MVYCSTSRPWEPISKPEPAILCGGLLRLWETPAAFARKSVHLDPVLRSTFINRHYCHQTWIMPLFKLITTLILQRTPTSQARVFITLEARKNPGYRWSRDSQKIDCLRGEGKVSYYMLPLPHFTLRSQGVSVSTDQLWELHIRQNSC
jgi:hypothetical protein